MWGGETTADELRRIADAVDKYKIPTVKVTGGQRIDLLGVKKEDLVNVWKDIGMPSGHAYAKALRTVKTCVGSEWCRMGTQDSTQMGKDLERAMWRMYAPHKVKFAVSGCPRNCAEAGIKDVGIIGVDSGWEMYIAGNGGIKTEVAHFFVKVKTAAEVLEYTGAFCELYRQEGWYLERTVHYVNRVGLDYVKKTHSGGPRRPQGPLGAVAVCAGRRARPLVRLQGSRGGHAPVRDREHLLVKIRRRTLIAAAAGLPLWNARAQVSDLNDAINKAGRQRMLSQRMGKGWLALVHKTESASAQAVLDKSMALFDRQLVELKAFAPSTDIRDTYVKLEAAWSDYKTALVGATPGKPGAGAVLQADARVLALAHQGTLQYEAAPAARWASWSTWPGASACSRSAWPSSTSQPRCPSTCPPPRPRSARRAPSF